MMNRLDLEEWIVRVELDRDVRSCESQVDEQWSEPSIRFDDPLVALVSEAPREICRRTDQQAPAGRGARDESAPKSHASRILERPQERRGVALHLGRRDAVEMLREIRKLRRIERIP